ncbi:cutinase [Xylariomycetidae sp. FL0641]|nr:cutinase [Xylariomycetidae sp. FL0641]
MQKILHFLSLAAALSVAAAGPLKVVSVSAPAARDDDLDVRDLPTERNDLEHLGPGAICPEVILIYARGSIEPGNMGLLAGPELAIALQVIYGDSALWVQGVGGAYDGDLAANFLPKGTSQAAIDEAVRLFEKAHSKCPETPVVAGGYSQGTAVMAGAIASLPPALQDQVKGVVLFGYTENEQNGGAIPGFPPAKTQVYCATLDVVCNGALFVLPSHFLYWIPATVDAPLWLEEQLGI